MRNIVNKSWAVAAALAACVLVGALTGAAGSGAQPASQPSPEAKPTIVLVHGAWADGSSWAAVTKNLQHSGFTVDIEPNPLRGVASDTQYLKDYLATIAGPIVLVGHSYGGTVITNAATGNPNVKGLVYIDAYLPEQGETLNELTTAKPGSVLAVADPSTVFNTVSNTGPDGTVASVDLYVKQTLFPGFFADGIPKANAAVLAAGQRPLTLSALNEASPNVSAWHAIPSWALIGTADRVLPPAEQEVMAARAGAQVVKINAPHLSMVSNPGTVTDLITTAAAAS